jgi:molecular chaperone DnaK (HSP70)
MGIAVGIDLGTTNSVVALYRRGSTKVIENMDSDTLTPSAVYITPDNEVIVGKSAQVYSKKEADQVVFSIKRFMGRDFNDPAIAGDIQRFPYQVLEAQNGEVDVLLRGRRFSPPEISAFIIEYLKRSVEESTGEEVTHAVITVPAYFGNRQKEATRLAGYLANLQVMTILPEPTAAALSYGYGTDMEAGKVVLVYDLGGGTFDVTVMDISSGCFDDLGKSGDMHLGGDDFDERIMDWVNDQVHIQHGVDLYGLNNSEIKFTLKSQAQQAKLRLSRATRTPIALPGLARVNNRLIDVDSNLSRDEFNSMIQPHLDHTIKLVYEAIRKASYNENDIDHILMVGGSTRVPAVSESLVRIFGDKVIRGELNPMHCVAEGAAYQTNLPLPTSTADTSKIKSCKSCGALNLVDRPDCRCCAAKFSGKSIHIQEKGKQEIRMIICPSCQQETPQDNPTCIKCGTPQGIVLQKIPRPIGVEIVEGKMQIILNDDMYYPTREPVVKTLQTTEPGQQEARLPIYEGDDPIAKNNQFLGLVRGDLPPSLPENTKVDVAIGIDNDGILEVTARIPDRPDFKMEAKIEWKGKKLPEPTSGGANGGRGSPVEPDWKNDVEMTLIFVRLVLDEGSKIIPENEEKALIELATKTQQALMADQKDTALQFAALLKKVLDRYGLLIEIGYARVLAQNPDVARKAGIAKVEQLKRGLNRVDEFMRVRNIDQVVAVMTEDVSPVLAEIMRALGDEGGGPLGNMGKGLLRASSSGHY